MNLMKPYVPNNLPIKNVDWSKLIRLIGPANAEIARFDGISNSSL
jgi:hypothetical protein